MDGIFSGVSNQPEPTNLIDFEQETPMTLLDVTMDIISIEEVTKSIHALKNCKAGGLDEMTAELLKHGGETVSENSPTFSTLYGRQKMSQATWCHRETVEGGEYQRLLQLKRHYTALHPKKGVLFRPAKSDNTPLYHVWYVVQ